MRLKWAYIEFTNLIKGCPKAALGTLWFSVGNSMVSLRKPSNLLTVLPDPGKQGWLDESAEVSGEDIKKG